jgi:hypothetical protein
MLGLHIRTLRYEKNYFVIMKKITLLCVGNTHHSLMKKSIDISLRAIETECEEVLHITDRQTNDRGLILSNTFDIDQYNKLIVKELSGLIKTEFVMIIQYDGMAVNNKYWTNEFYNYDYIGAPWPDRFTWIEDSEKVGNGGFSLRSAKLLDVLTDDSIRFHNDNPRFKNEDAVICQGYSEYLKRKYKIKYATSSLANKFSHEWCNPTGKTFGFHGVWNTPLYFKEDEVVNFIQEIPKSHWLDDKRQMFFQNCRSKGYLRAIRKYSEIYE